MKIKAFEKFLQLFIGRYESWTVNDSKTFFLCSSESKMESKGTFESRINLITLDHTFLTPDLK